MEGQDRGDKQGGGIVGMDLGERGTSTLGSTPGVE